MDKRIVYKNLDGSCGIIIPSEQWINNLVNPEQPSPEINLDEDGNEIEIKPKKIKSISMKKALTMLAKKDVPEGLSWRIVDIKNIPEDRIYRAAWTDDNKTDTIDIDMGKAKIIHKKRLEEVIDKELEILDKNIPRSLEGADFLDDFQKEIVIKKKKLRKQRKAISLIKAKTVQELSSIEIQINDK